MSMLTNDLIKEKEMKEINYLVHIYDFEKNPSHALKCQDIDEVQNVIDFINKIPEMQGCQPDVSVDMPCLPKKKKRGEVQMSAKTFIRLCNEHFSEYVTI